jgi:hypothetical protein
MLPRPLMWRESSKQPVKLPQPAPFMVW